MSLLWSHGYVIYDSPSSCANVIKTKPLGKGVALVVVDKVFSYKDGDRIVIYLFVETGCM